MAYHPWFQSVDSHRTCLTVDPVGWEQFSKQWWDEQTWENRAMALKLRPKHK
jgi:hypothetical protein